MMWLEEWMTKVQDAETRAVTTRVASKILESSGEVDDINTAY